MSEIKHNQGEAGGYLVGRRHSTGGIKAVNKSTGQPLEMEGGEVVITRDAVSDNTKRSFNGKMMTNRQILSEINQSGGGVAFADGGEIPETMSFNSDAEYEYGGKTMCGCDLATEMSKAKSLEDGGSTDSLPISFNSPIDVIYNGWGRRRYGNEDRPKEDGGGLKVILREVLRDAASVADTSLQFKIGLQFEDPSGDKKYVPLIENQTYQKVVDEGGFDYDAVLKEFQNKISVSPDGSLEIAYSFYELNKIYFVGIEANVLGTDNASLPTDFRQDNFAAPSNGVGKTNSITHFLSFEPTDYKSDYAEEKSNYKDWEKVVRSLNKQVNGKAITTLAVSGYVRLATIQDGDSTSRVDAFISTGKPMVTKWSWWKKNLFEKTIFTDYFAIKDDSGAIAVPNMGLKELKLTFSDVDFVAYQQEFGSVLPSARSNQKQQKILSLMPMLIMDKSDEFTAIAKTTYRKYVFSPSKFGIEKIEKSGRYDVNVFIDFGVDDRIIPSIIQDKILFIGDDGLFSFNTNYSRGANFVLIRNEEAAKAAAEAARLKKEQEAAERAAVRAAQRKAEEEEKLRKQALKNREYQVRDQPEDFEFFDYEDLSDDNYKSKSEREALVTMLKIAKGPKNFAIRKAILKKIIRIDKQLEQERMSAMGNDDIDVNKLLTPKGLMDYYFNQTRQNPVKKMNEPCGLPTPTGVPSKLSLQAYNSVRTQYFKRWFGDWELAAETDNYADCSKIVDPETKEPRIMYHGVRKYDSRVDVANTGKGIVRPYAEFKAPNFPATYFGSDLSYVEFYAGMAENQPHPDPNYQGFVYYVFLNMRNPIYIDSLGISEYSYADLLAYIAIQYGLVIQPSQAVQALVKDRRDLKPWNYVRRDLNLIAEIKKAGFDGIVQVGNVPAFTPEGQVAEQDMVGDEYLVFDANQVKSAVVKNSFYVPMIDDIRFKDGGYVRI
jgi:hypothetical protein